MKLKRKGRILIADDEEVVRDSISDCLKQDGYDTVAVENGIKAIKEATESNFDLALVDLKMPAIDGIETLKRLQKVRPKLPVIIITAYATVENAVIAMKEGAVDYVMKPFDSDELHIRLEKALEKGRLVKENLYLRQELTKKYHFSNIIGKSKVMQDIFRIIEKVAPTDSTVLIHGQSGTGKELIAKAIHHNSLRKDKKFIAVDCGALPETLLESELFGHVKGSFTGAVVTKRGLLEVANTGTFFLDEVGDLSPGIQSKLLRVLQEKEFRQVGGVQNIKVDVRLIAATNKDLEKMIKKDEFREDLFYRLNIVPINLPLLRERREDIPLFVEHFLDLYARKRNKTIKGITSKAMGMFIGYDWPGNVRELENIIERVVIMSDSKTIDVKHIPSIIQGEESFTGDTVPKTNSELLQYKKHIRKKVVVNIEKAFVTKALERNDGNISKAAQEVGLQRQNFQAMMRKYKIKA